jgi:hypothetical protein
MTCNIDRREPCPQHTRPADLVAKPIEDWSPDNRNFYAGFRKWLHDGGYSR